MAVRSSFAWLARVRALASSFGRLEPHHRPQLRRLPKNVEQARRELQAASVDGSLDGRPDRFIRIGYRPRTAPGNIGLRLFLG